MAHLCVLIIIPPPLNLDPEAGGDIPDALQSTNVASQTYSCLVAKALSTHCTPHISFGGLCGSTQGAWGLLSVAHYKGTLQCSAWPQKSLVLPLIPASNTDPAPHCQGCLEQCCALPAAETAWPTSLPARGTALPHAALQHPVVPATIPQQTCTKSQQPHLLPTSTGPA